TAFTGGLNVGDEYVGRQKDKYWRDTHVKIHGLAVKQLEEVFLEDWFFSAEKKYSIKSLLRLIKKSRPHKRAEQTAPLVHVVPSGPTDRFLLGVLLFMQLIDSAKKRLWIASPYFVPDVPLQRALELAVLRGVDVRLLLPKMSDHRVVHWVSMSYAEEF